MRGNLTLIKPNCDEAKMAVSLTSQRSREGSLRSHHSLLAVVRDAAKVVDRRAVFDGDGELEAGILHAALEGASLLSRVADAQGRRLSDSVRLYKRVGARSQRRAGHRCLRAKRDALVERSKNAYPGTPDKGDILTGRDVDVEGNEAL